MSVVRACLIACPAEPKTGVASLNARGQLRFRAASRTEDLSDPVRAHVDNRSLSLKWPGSSVLGLKQDSSCAEAQHTGRRECLDEALDRRESRDELALLTAELDYQADPLARLTA